MFRRLLKFSAATFAFVAIMIVGGWTTYHLVVGADPLVVATFGSKNVVDLIRTADRVEAFRTEGNLYGKPKSDNPDRIGGYEIISGPIVVDKKSHGDLARVLTSASTYGWISFKLCAPQPGVAFRFTKGETTQVVLLCFECDLLVLPQEDQQIHVEDFDYGRAELVGIVKRLFPEDAVIQELEEKR